VKVRIVWAPTGGYFKSYTDGIKDDDDDDDRHHNTRTESVFPKPLFVRYSTEYRKKAEGLRLAPTPQTGVFQPEFCDT